MTVHYPSHFSDEIIVTKPRVTDGGMPLHARAHTHRKITQRYLDDLRPHALKALNAIAVEPADSADIRNYIIRVE
jgi:hypothetical protein